MGSPFVGLLRSKDLLPQARFCKEGSSHARAASLFQAGVSAQKNLPSKTKPAFKKVKSRNSLRRRIAVAFSIVASAIGFVPPFYFTILPTCEPRMQQKTSATPVPSPDSPNFSLGHLAVKQSSPRDDLRCTFPRQQKLLQSASFTQFHTAREMLWEAKKISVIFRSSERIFRAQRAIVQLCGESFEEEKEKPCEIRSLPQSRPP